MQYAEGVDYGENIEPFIEAIQPYIVNHYQLNEYCGSITDGAYNIYHVNLDEGLIGCLCAGLHLYNWIYPNLPEDLCFYKKDKCFLSSNAHEKLCWIYTEDKDEIKALEKMGLRFIEMPFEEPPSL